MKIVAIIPARGGSKRLFRKNIKKINGLPMLAYAIKACKESKYDIDVYVSTEDKEIDIISKSLGASTLKRPKHLSDDYTFKQDVIVNAICSLFEKKEKPDIVISLQPNSPEIKSYHIDEAIDIKIKNERKEIFSVDNNLMQNGAFRIMDYDYIFQKSLSTYCGVYVCDIIDVHTKEDFNLVLKKMNN